MKKNNSLHADILLYNGVFITIDPAMPHATALAIKEGNITWVGDQKDSSFWIGNNTQVIDLQGCFVYPGFIDTHMHVLYTGMVKTYLQIKASLDKQAILRKVEEHLTHCQKDEWVVGVGWDDHHWSEKRRWPHAFDLDAIAPNNPVVLQRNDTHLIWVNSLVLKLAGIDANTPNPVGGIIERDSSGNPSGILIDKAMLLVKNIMPILGLQECIQTTQSVLQECLQKGITTVHNASTDEVELEVFKHLAAENALKVRVYMMAAVRDKKENYFMQHGPQIYNSFLQLRCLKIWMDGALGSRGAALLDPYNDDSENRGLLLWDEKDLISILRQAKSKGFQVAIHAIGDRANHCVLDAYEKIGVRGLRWRIEHAQLLAPSDIKRFAKLEVIAAMQPLHATMDMMWIKDRIGAERIQAGAFALRSLLETGAIVVGGSDSPVADLNPLWGMHAAVTRQNQDQFPETGWYPEQRMTREEALKMYTIHAAYSCFRENEVGSLTQGKLADLVVLPENLLTCSVKSMLDMKVLYTIVNGKISFKK